MDQQMEPEDTAYVGDLAARCASCWCGELDDADIEALIALIEPEAANEPAPAQDRRRQNGLAHDALRRHVSAGLARRTQAEIADLVGRFPALKNARVVG